MTTALAPDLIYRVITDYEALVDAFADRVEELNTPLTEIDAASGMTRGNMQRLLRSADPKDWRPSNKRKQSRAFGWETLAKTLEGTGMVMVLMIDDARFAAIKDQLPKRKRRDKRAIARIARPAWLFKKKRAREMGIKRWKGVSDSKRNRIMKRVAKARWRRAKSPSAGRCPTPQPVNNSFPGFVHGDILCPMPDQLTGNAGNPGGL